jgi:hypothetical protein
VQGTANIGAAPAQGRRARFFGTAGVGFDEMAAFLFDLWRRTSDACRPLRSPVFR